MVSDIVKLLSLYQEMLTRQPGASWTSGGRGSPVSTTMSRGQGA